MFCEVKEDCAQQAEDADQLRKQVSEAKQNGDQSVAPIWAGSSIGLIKSIEPAEELVTRLAQSAFQLLQQASS